MKQNKLGSFPMRIECYTFLVVVLLICLTGTAARADECDDMAAAIAKKSGLAVGKRKGDPPAYFIPLSGDEYGAYLNCQGPSGMSLHVVSPTDHVPDDWYQFVGRSVSVLTGVSPASVIEGVRRCVRSAPPPDDVGNLSWHGFRIFCETDRNDEGIELTITQRP